MTMTASLEGPGLGGVGTALFFPWLQPLPHTRLTDCAYVRGGGMRVQGLAPHLTPGPMGEGLQGRVLASSVGNRMGVLGSRREEGLDWGTCNGCMFFEASIMIFKQ